MKNLTLLALILVCFQQIKAQVTIGSKSKPVYGALLDLKEDDNTGVNSTKGFLLPRVNITTLNNLKADIKIGNEDVKSYVGLIVYNPTALIEQCLIIPKGIYIWDGGQWQAIGEQKAEIVTPEGSLKEELQILKNLRDKYKPYLNDAIPDYDVNDPKPEANTFITFNELCGQLRVDWINFSNVSQQGKDAIDDVTPLTKIPGLRNLVLDGF